MSGVERRIQLGPVIGIVGALLLIVSLFLDWYEQVTAFKVFEMLDLVLLSLALLTIASLAAALGAAVPAALRPGRALVIASVTALIVVSQILNDPPAVAGEGAPAQATGIWLALGGSLAMVVGALLATSRIAVAVDVRRREPRAPAPSPDPRAAESAAPERARPASTSEQRRPLAERPADDDETEPLPGHERS